MITYLGKSCSFGLLCVSFVGVCQILCVSFLPFGIESKMWILIVLILDHCLSIYFGQVRNIAARLTHAANFKNKNWDNHRHRHLFCLDPQQQFSARF